MNMKLNINDVVFRKLPATPWVDGGKIPWNDPEFSQRMLREHLSQDHDLASRRSEIIDRHTAWIFQDLLESRSAKVLDLGCGPGFYSQRLAELGCKCKGIDFSPASIEFARKEAKKLRQNQPKYVLDDIRNANFGDDYDLVMLLFGEFNVFPPKDAGLILRKAMDALTPGGILLLEPAQYDTIKASGDAPATWSTGKSGLFSPEPHMVLKESFWSDKKNATIERFYVVDSKSAEVEIYTSSTQAYTNKQLKSILQQMGFENIKSYKSLGNTGKEALEGLFAISAQRKK
jgi:SAM-dependent methyltransferase